VTTRPAADPDSPVALVARIEALGDLVSEALPASLDAEATDRLASLVRERDDLVARLARAVEWPGVQPDTMSRALDRAAAQTESLIALVAGRADVLREALRDLDRSSRATAAYHASTAAAHATVDARR
jgi:hypothetical protein